MSRDIESGTATQEINFWLSMESALEGIEEQLRSDGVQLTLGILKHAKRFHATVSFIADTGLKEATDKGRVSFYPSARAIHVKIPADAPISNSAKIQPTYARFSP